MVLHSMFREIISVKNLEAAYIELIGQFAKDSKESHYHGLDNKKIFEYDLDSKDLLSQIRNELIEKKSIEPAILLHIPKKSNPAKTREIFIYTLKERVKAQAVYRVVLPVFERSFSDRLFSYRPGKPPYIASYLFARRYRRRFREDSCLVVDLHNYSSLIDRGYLVEKLKVLFPDEETMEVLKLFIFNHIYDQGMVRQPTRGIVQGVPLIALFANLYLSDLDFEYDKRAAFYIRVGDDLAIVDPDSEKLKHIARELQVKVVNRGLELNQDKLFIGPSREKFSFLGYDFSDGMIRLQKNYITQLELGWKNILVYKHESLAKKKLILKRIMQHEEENFNAQFQEIIKNKPQINDSDQIRKLSEHFFRIMTEFYYGRYSPRNRRLVEPALRTFGIFSLYSHYKRFHYERDERG